MALRMIIKIILNAFIGKTGQNPTFDKYVKLLVSDLEKYKEKLGKVNNFNKKTKKFELVDPKFTMIK